VNEIRKILFISFFVVFALITQPDCARCSQFQDPPNIILIILDSARADHFSCYGYHRNTTPRIDAISREGILFKNHFAHSTGTYSSLSNIFFSRYFYKNILQWRGCRWGVRHETPNMVDRHPDSQQISLMEVLSRNGFYQAVFSDHDLLSYRVYPWDQFDEQFHAPPSEKVVLNESGGSDTILATLSSWLDENRRRRFFVYWHILPPHWPYRDGIEDRSFLEGISEEQVEAVKNKLSGIRDGSASSLNEGELFCMQGLYDSNLKYADYLVGKLYDKLNESGLLEKTILIITADHGENLGDHGSVFHGKLPWDSVVRVPLIVSCPSRLPQGCKVESMSEHVDVAPTILDLSGAVAPAGKAMDGVSLKKYVRKRGPKKTAVFGKDYVRTLRYKYIFSENFLSDLTRDPEETVNIADREPAIKEKLRNEYDREMKPFLERHEKTKTGLPPPDPFYYSLDSFLISPEECFERLAAGDVQPLDDEKALQSVRKGNKPWLLNSSWSVSELVACPTDHVPMPVTLSAYVPNGTYQILLLLKSTRRIEGSVRETGLQYRFDFRLTFRLPKDFSLFTNLGERVFYYYLDLGETKIKDGKFSLQIGLPPSRNGLRSVGHIKFVPISAGFAKEEGGGNDLRENNAFQEKTEALKSLGYL